MRELAVPQYRQRTCYTCGPAALLSCFRYLRVAGRSSEKSLAQEMGTTFEDGTTFDAMVECARKRVPRADWMTGLSINFLKNAIGTGKLCILAIQAWTERPEVAYWDEFDSGHYVIATAVGRTRVYFMDPSMSRVRASLTHRQLLERWHELDFGRQFHGAGIVIEGPIPRWRELGAWKEMG